MRFILISLLAFAGCQCVDVPDRRYADDDAGSVDGGSSTDAGEADAGAADAGSGDAGPLFCNSWSCVLAGWAPDTRSLSTVGSRHTPIPAGVDGGEYGWFGGVLLPDGRVLAVPWEADHFLLFDPRTFEVSLFGEALVGAAGERKYAGAVLAPNGRVYVFPYQRHRVLEVDVELGTMREIGPAFAGLNDAGPNYTGGVVDRYGAIWSPSESREGLPFLRIDPSTSTVTRWQPKSERWGGGWGMTRLPDDSIVAFPKEGYVEAEGLQRELLVFEPGPDAPEDGGVSFRYATGFDLLDGGAPLTGGSLTRSGTVVSLPSSNQGLIVTLGSSNAGYVAVVRSGITSYLGSAASYADGRVWTTPDDSRQLFAIDADGGASAFTFDRGGRYKYLGLVATPQGLIGIPCLASGGEAQGFLSMEPGAATGGLYDTRPMRVLLSPYFNKL